MISALAAASVAAEAQAPVAPVAIGVPLAPALLPRLTTARAPLTEAVQVVDESGATSEIRIPAERALTIYLDKRELVTLMTLGAQPEWLVLGYLLNQGLVARVSEVDSITVDWDVAAAAVRTREGFVAPDVASQGTRVVTTGCGQGSMFSHLMDDLAQARLVRADDTYIGQEQLFDLVNTIRVQESTYKSAGSVHACALFAVPQDGRSAPHLNLFVEDVGRHNALDTLAGWRALQAAEAGVAPALYTTGRLTSEMIIKSAQMGVSLVVSRSGMTHMGHQIAQQLGICAVGRALARRYVCFSRSDRLRRSAALPGLPAAPVPAPVRVAPPVG